MPPRAHDSSQALRRSASAAYMRVPRASPAKARLDTVPLSATRASPQALDRKAFIAGGASSSPPTFIQHRCVAVLIAPSTARDRGGASRQDKRAGRIARRKARSRHCHERASGSSRDDKRWVRSPGREHNCCGPHLQRHEMMPLRARARPPRVRLRRGQANHWVAGTPLQPPSRLISHRRQRHPNARALPSRRQAA